MSSGPTTVYIPPRWVDIIPLILCSSAVWSCLLFFAALRESFHCLRTSKRVRVFMGYGSSSSLTEPRNIKMRIYYTFVVSYKKLRLFLAKWKIRETDIIRKVTLPRCIIGVLVCLFYCWDTYQRRVSQLFYMVQFLYGLLVVVCLCYDFVYAERPFVFVWQLCVIVECLTIPSLILSSHGLWLNLNFLQAYAILQRWYILKQHEIVLRNVESRTKMYTDLGLELFTFVFITACGVHFFELLGDPGSLGSSSFQTTWANCVYFAVVTIMTVGYGDFVPYTLLGRIWIVLHIVLAAYVVTRQTTALFETEKKKRRGSEAYVRAIETNHVVLTGNVKWEFLKQFIKEFLKEVTNLNTKIVVLSSMPTWDDEEWNRFISRNPFHDYHVIFIEGTPLEHDDLVRVSLGSARAVFVLADPHRNDPYLEDSDTLKAVLSMRNFAGKVPIFTFNISHDSSFQFGIAMEQLEDENFPFGFPSMANFSTALIQEGDDAVVGSDDRNVAAHYRQRQDHERGGSSSSFRGASTNEHIRHSSILASISNELYTQEESDVNLPQWNSEGLHLDEEHFQHGLPPQAFTKTHDDRKGESICMQELEMALLAENVFCNGLSTLISNLTLRYAPVPRPSDKTWLQEYKLGAQCCIFSFKIPDEFHRRKYRDIAPLLQDYGIVLLAVLNEDKWSIITLNTELEKGMQSMIITFHNPGLIEHIAKKAVDTLINVERSEFERSVLSQTITGGKSASTSAMPNIRRLLSLREERRERTQGLRTTFRNPGNPSSSQQIQISEPPYQNNGFKSAGRSRSNAETGKSFVESTGNSAESISGLRQTSSSRRAFGESSSTPQLPQISESSQEEPRPGTSLTFSTPTPKKKPPKKKTSTTRFADEVESSKKRPKEKAEASEHTGSGDGPIGGDDRVQKRIPHRIYSNLHPIVDTLSRHVIVCLDGENSLTSLKVLLKRIWKRRKDQRRRTQVVVIHPNFPKNFEKEIPEQNLYLLRGHSLSIKTLEQAHYKTSRAVLVITSENSDTDSGRNTDSKAIFTVMTLDSLLSQARIFVCCMLDAEDSLRLMRAPKHQRQIAFMREDSGLPSFGPDRLVAANRSYSATLLAGAFGSSYGSISHGRSSSAPNRKKLNASKRSTTFISTLNGDEPETDDERDQSLHSNDNGSLQSNMSSSGGELCERQRYASGEMIISSLFSALLVREEAQPGYSRVIRELLGLASNSEGNGSYNDEKQGSWIRLLQIPESWTNSGPIHDRNYRDTSIRLQELGCIAIGLYRSGRAPVRWAISWKEGIWERRTEEIVYTEETEKSALLGLHSQHPLSFHVPSSYHTRSAVRNSASGIGDQLDFLEKGNYRCPTTNRTIEYGEKPSDNVLPYVYCFPEPYTLVDSSDGIFVLCDPDLAIPADWLV